MSPDIRLQCLRLASERLGKDAPLQELFDEANRMLAYVQGHDIVGEVDGKQFVGRKL